MWCVASWDLPVQLPQLTGQHLVLVLAVSGWIISSVEEESRRFLNVVMMDGELTTGTVTIGQMQV